MKKRFPRRMWLLVGVLALIPVNFYGTHVLNAWLAFGAIGGQIAFYVAYQVLKYRAQERTEG